MKANELMIGDWVKTPLGIGKVTAIDAVCLPGFQTIRVSHKKRQEDQDAFVNIDKVQPIPLTPEILEKNFQEFLPGINLMYQLKGPYCAMNEDGQWVFGLVKVTGENSARYPLVKISFVHELQHAMRLCGIEKEIDI